MLSSKRISMLENTVLVSTRHTHFEVSQFEQLNLSPSLLLACLKPHHPIDLTSPSKIIRSLNKIIENTSFYSEWRAGQSEKNAYELDQIIIDNWALGLREELEKPFEKLNPKQKDEVRRFNRFIIEYNFPNITPRLNYPN